MSLLTTEEYKAIAASLTFPTTAFIDGHFRPAIGGKTFDTLNPATGEVLAKVAACGAEDVDVAVAKARDAFEDGRWSRLHPKERKEVLIKLAKLVRRNARELAVLESLDSGKTIYDCEQVDVPETINCLTWHAELIDKIYDQMAPASDNHIAMVVREPVGVVGLVLPWNFPLLMLAWKIGPALAAGCSVIVKPAEETPLTTLRMAELAMEAGVPAGVFNVVPGTGPEVGEAIITHPGVDKVTFTGSRAVGSRVMAAAAERIARVSLELGGKSPNIVFDDVDVGGTAAALMGMVSMGLSGQGCVCHTRALVQDTVYDEMIDACAAMAAMSVLGDPFDPGTTSGPIINGRQLARVEGLIAGGRDEGARLVVGGDRPGGDLAAGNFVNPTLFADVDNAMTIAREEIFGPVLAMIPFHDEDEAIRLANATDYGLGASVQTSDVKRAIRVAQAVRSGTFGVNGYTVMPNAPFGGMKTSGVGREGGREGIDAFLESKTVVIATGDSLF